MITSVQLQKLDALYANGQVEGISADQLESFSEDEADLLIQECEEVPPYTFLPMSPDMREELLSLIRSGVLGRVSEADLKYMTVHTGEALLWSVMSSFLSGGSPRQIRNLTKHMAEKLIREGEYNARKGVRSEGKFN